jgi:uncharacterized SAM-binding protein YcdF (DUF218 family)
MTKPRTRRMGFATLLSRLFFLVGIVGVGVLAGGFGWFAETVTGMKPPREAPVADGVAALTGGSDARLRAAVTLIEIGKAKRLLISGVNTVATAEEVRLVAGGSRALYGCCVSLGRTAADTIGNAREIRAWADEYKLRSIIIVTDTYHMPRAMLEITHAVPGVVLTPWPVRDTVLSERRWWQDERATRALALEYGKYVVVMGRISFGLRAREAPVEGGAGVGTDPGPAKPAEKAA